MIEISVNSWHPSTSTATAELQLIDMKVCKKMAEMRNQTVVQCQGEQGSRSGQ